MKRMFIRRTAVLEAIVLLLVIVLPILSEKAEAVGFTQAYVRFDRMKSNTATTGMICAKPSSTLTTYRKLEVTFPDEGSATDFVLGIASTFQNTNVSTTDIDGNTAWPDIANATAGVAGNVVTWTHTSDQSLNSANTYCFRWLNTTGTAVTTPTTAGASSLVGTIRALTSADAELMNTKYSTAVIADDQLVISATVPPTFSVAFGDGGDADADANTDSFQSNLTTTPVTTYGNTVTIGTNAGAGWIAWVKSTNTALNSSSTGATIDSIGTVNGTPDDISVATGTPGYVLDVNATTQGGGTGTMTIDAEYNGGTDTGGSLNSTVFEPIASANGTTDGDVFTLIEKARIAATQAAATDYTDTLTIVAAGQF